MTELNDSNPQINPPAWRLVPKALAWLAFVLSAVACTHQPAQPQQVTCAHIDWFEMGRSDGSYGLPFARIQEHQARCNNTPHPVDFDLYTNGRNVGLLEYCTAAIGAQVARDGRTYEGVCPDYLEKKFISGYEIGKRIVELEKENETVASRMAEIRQHFGAGPKAATRTPATGPLRSELEQLRQRRAQIDNELDTLESQDF